MKLKDGFITYNSGDQQILVPTGGQKFSGLVRSNETAAFIIEALKKETTRENVIQTLAEHYGIDADRAGRGVDSVLDQLRRIGALDE